MRKVLLMSFSVVAAGLVGLILAGPVMLPSYNNNASAQLITDNNNSTEDQQPGYEELLGIPNDTNDTQTSAANGTQVDVGGGSNTTVQYYTFTPNIVEINTGESVTWTSSAQLLEFHTVTFRDPSVITELILPFATTDEDPEVLPPFNTGEAIIMNTPNGPAILGANKIAFNPTVIDANNQTSYLNGTEIEYSMSGDEKVLNSGIIQPPYPPLSIAEDIQNDQGAVDEEIVASEHMNETDVSEAEEGEVSGGGGPPFPFVNSFTVTFEQPGTYDYFCALHPWMTGQVVVVDGGDSSGTTTSSLDGLLGNNTTTTDSMGSPGGNMTTFEETANSGIEQ